MTRLRALGAAALSGVLLAGAFPPLDLGPLALVALVPLLWAWRGAGRGRAAACGAVAGLVFFGFIVSWTYFFGAVAFLPFALFLASWWVLLGLAVAVLSRRGVAGPPVVAALWVIVEAARARVPFGGFSWGEVGYAFHDLPVARSVAAWGGVLGVSFLAVTFNGLVLEAALACRRGRPAAGIIRPAAGGIAILIGAFTAHVLLPELSPTGRLTFALVQGNDRNRDFTPEERADRYLVKNELRLADGIENPVDLVVFPESSLDADPRSDPFLDTALTAVARRLDAAVLAGGNTWAPGGRVYNTTFLFGAEGRRPEMYQKRHLVPFGEFVPWRSALSFIDALDAVPTDYEPGGDGGTLFPVPTEGTERRIGPLICFESAFGPLARGYARQGAEALVVSTNNRSFERSANSAQHLAMSQIRAAEVGRPVLQAGLSGRSGVIDASGDLISQTELFEATVLSGSVTTMTGRTPYVALGEWAVGLAVVVVAGGLVAGRGRRGERS